MEYSQSLKKNRDFRRLYARGKSAANPFLVMYCRRNKLGVNRLGVTVGKKLGCAVVRNRVRRRVREAYRLSEGLFSPGWDMVVVARSRAAEAGYQELSSALLSLARSLGPIAGGKAK